MGGGGNLKVIERKVDGKKTSVIKINGQFYIRNANGDLQPVTMTKKGSIFGKAQFTTSTQNQSSATGTKRYDYGATSVSPQPTEISTRQQQDIDSVATMKMLSQHKPARDDNGHATRDAQGRITGGTLKDGRTYTRTYNADGSYVDTYSDGEIQNYDANGKKTGGKVANGKTYTCTYNADGSSVDTYSDGGIANYDANGKKTGGTAADRTTYTCKYNADGSYVEKYSNGEIANYDANGKLTGGTTADRTTYTCKYNEDGNLKYIEFTKEDGSKYYGGDDGKSYATRTKNGNLKVNPKQGETFQDTMVRLGITDAADQQAFINANPKAYKRGYFLLADAGTEGGDVYIPKAIADKLDIQNTLVDETAEMQKHQDALRAKHN